MRVLIVDDEPLARRGVRARLRNFSDVEIVDECGDGESAVESIVRLGPDLVFLDVQMPGMNGFDVLRALPSEQLPVVIFLTAHQEHALRAFEIHALDYLLKPLEDERFAVALNRARQQIDTARKAELVGRMLGMLDQSDRYSSRFVVRAGPRIHIVSVNEVEWIAAADDYSELHTRNGTHILRETMRSLEKRLDPARFARIHRSKIVRLDQIVELQTIENREHVLRLRDGSQHRSSRTYADRLEHSLRPGNDAG